LEIESQDDEPQGLWEEIEQTEFSLTARAASIVLLLLGGLIVLALPIAAVGVMVRAATAGQIDPHLNPLNMIFASRAVVGAARLSLLFVAAYVIFSCIGLIAERRWLISFWPPKASDPVSKSVKSLVEDREMLSEALGEANETIEGLQIANADLVAEITELGEAYNEAVDYISTIQPEEDADASDT
jgi:hypothetical protein